MYQHFLDYVNRLLPNLPLFAAFCRLLPLFADYGCENSLNEG